MEWNSDSKYQHSTDNGTKLFCSYLVVVVWLWEKNDNTCMHKIKVKPNQYNDKLYLWHFSNINLHVACNFFIQIRSIWDCSVVMLCIFQIIQQITTTSLALFRWSSPWHLFKKNHCLYFSFHHSFCYDHDDPLSPYLSLKQLVLVEKMALMLFGATV